jgi:hypothetical protein
MELDVAVEPVLLLLEVVLVVANCVASSSSSIDFVTYRTKHFRTWSALSLVPSQQLESPG